MLPFQHLAIVKIIVISNSERQKLATRSDFASPLRNFGNYKTTNGFQEKAYVSRGNAIQTPVEPL